MTEESTEPTRSPRAGRPSRSLGWLWALVTALGGLALTTVLMSAERSLPAALPIGLVACLVSSVGFLYLLTPRASPEEARAERSPVGVAGSVLLRPLLLWLLGLGLHLGSGVLAVAGVLPLPRLSAAVLVTATFVGLSIASYRLLARVGVFDVSTGEAPPLLRRHGFWLLAITSGVYLPMLGSFALLDPWETHYGEVAREMIARDDWISLWWAQDGWFFTKPILNFWLQGVSFVFFGVGVLPDQMLAGALQGRVPQPEWACRLPVFWMTAAAVYALYKASARFIGRRSAFVGGLILVTCPYWLLLARQTMADMPYVAPLTVALACLLLGFGTDPEARVRAFRVQLGRHTLRFDAYHVLFGVVLLCVLPQVAYLLSRNVTLHLGDPFGFRPHWDEFAQGSGGGNCGLPGNRRCGAASVAHAWGQPGLFALCWLGLALGLAAWNRRERRTQRLLFLAAWFAAALSVMAKGAPGLVLPLATALGFPLVTGRFREILRLKLPALLVLTACVALPWYVQMFMRHGWPFFDRLVMHDMVNRAFAHVHDTNTGEDVSFRYYLWQLGYGLFPWTGFAAGGLVWWARSRREADHPRQLFALFMLLWFLAAFGMFSLTLTKFHHYVLPLVPPVAMLAGSLVARYLPRGFQGSPRRWWLYFALMVAAAEALLFGVACFFPGWKTLLVASNAVNPASPWLGAAGLALGAGLLWAAVHFAPPMELGPPNANRGWALGAVAIAATSAVLLAGRDLITTEPGAVRGELRLLHLITYNYDRPWPEVLDLVAPIAGFVAVASLAGFALAWRRVRHHAAVLFCSVAVLWAAWCCNEYLVRIAPHWAQRDNMLAYYRHRQDPRHLLVAYQMNWKGENFYTGNRMATFVSSGAKFKRWLKQQRQRGVHTLFFTTEHSRLKSLKKELGDVERFEQLTSEKDNNKFFVAKVVFPPYREDPKAVDDPETDDEAEE